MGLRELQRLSLGPSLKKVVGTKLMSHYRAPTDKSGNYETDHTILTLKGNADAQSVTHSLTQSGGQAGRQSIGHSLTHSLTHSHTHSLTHSLTQPLRQAGRQALPLHTLKGDADAQGQRRGPPRFLPRSDLISKGN